MFTVLKILMLLLLSFSEVSASSYVFKTELSQQEKDLESSLTFIGNNFLESFDELETTSSIPHSPYLHGLNDLGLFFISDRKLLSFFKVSTYTDTFYYGVHLPRSPPHLHHI